MGLAVSSQPHDERVRELVEASAGDRDALAAARERLGDLRLGDPSLRQSAIRLLAAAAGAIDRVELVPEPLDAVS